MISYQSPAGFSGLGGQDYDPATFKAAALRAELVELANQCCLEHAAQIIDKILAEYTVTSKCRKYA